MRYLQPAISEFDERPIGEGYRVFAGGLADTTAATVPVGDVPSAGAR